MSKLKVKNNLGNLKYQIKYIKSKEKELQDWSIESANNFISEYSRLISIQGRSGEVPPPLSPATHKIQKTFGKPDGSGIRDYLEVSYNKDNRGNLIATAYINDSKAQMIASVQEYGALIPVTEKMRGKLAFAGIFLRSDTKYIRIPARYAWKKAYNNTIKESKRKLKDILNS